jgi:hypothetical protein
LYSPKLNDKEKDETDTNKIIVEIDELTKSIRETIKSM